MGLGPLLNIFQVCRPVRAFVFVCPGFLRVASRKSVYLLDLRQDMLAGALGQADLQIKGSVPFDAVR